MLLGKPGPGERGAGFSTTATAHHRPPSPPSFRRILALMIFETKDTTSGNFRMSTSKWRSSSLYAFAVTILQRSRTAPKLRRYPAGSSCGSGGLGMATLDIGLGEKGVSGVPGPPVVLVVPADVRFKMRPLVLIGVMMLEEPEVREDLDCELESVGGGLATFGALSLLENRPMAARESLGGRTIGQYRAVCRWPIRDSTAGPGTELVTLWGKHKRLWGARRLGGRGLEP